MQSLPNPKIFAVLIVCIAIVGSVWLLEKNNVSENGTATLSATSTVIDTAHFPTNWVKPDDISLNTGTTTVLTYSGEGTITDQISKDFFSQYLIQLKNNNADISSDDATQIAQNTLARSNYLETAAGIHYTEKDLHLSSDTSKEAVQAYADTGLRILQKHSNDKFGSELMIVSQAVKSGKESQLAELDPIIAQYKGLISDLLAMKVPSDAQYVHVIFINVLSARLSNIEAMRQSLIDPVKAFAALAYYTRHIGDIEIAMKGIERYVNGKLQ